MNLKEEPRERIIDLIKQSAVYGVGALATQLAGFFLLPVLTRVLTPSQYGIVFLAEMLGLLMFVISELGLTSAFFRFYADATEDLVRRSLVFTVFNLLILASLLVTAACLLFSGQLSRVVFGSSAWRDAFVLVCVTNLFTVLSRMPLDLLRMNRRAALYVFISFCRLVGTFLVSFYLVVYARRGAMGVLEGTLVGTVVGFVMLAPVVLRHWRPAMEPSIVKKALRFGVFLVPAGLAVWALNQSDRYLLERFGDLTMVAVYGVGFKFASVTNVFLVTPFLTAWTPFMFRVSTQDDAKHLYARVLTYFVLASVGTLVILSATIKEITQFVAGVSYASAATVVPFIALGFVLYGTASIIVVGVYLREKTYHVTLAMALGAIAKIVLSIFLIPVMGVLGVAFATVLAFGAVLVYFLLALRRLFPVSYELARILKIVIAGVVSFSLLTTIPVGGWRGLLAKAAGSLVFLILLWMVRFPSREEKQKIKNAFGGIASRVVTRLKNLR